MVSFYNVAGSLFERVSRAFYAAAKPLPGGRPTFPIDGDINDILEMDLPIVRGGVRQLVRDFGPFAAAVDKYCSFVVGSGIRYQARVRLPKKAGETRAKLDRELNQKLERHWARFCCEADITGRMHLGEMMSLAMRQLCECGEAIFLIVHDNDPARLIPLSLQAIEPDRLTESGAQVTNGYALSKGIEYEVATGKPVRYYIDSGEYRKPMVVPAERVIHIFETIRPGQRRGISPFAAGIVSARMLSRYFATELQGAELQSRYHAFVTSPDLHFFQQGRIGQNQPKRLERIVGGVIEYLRPGERIDFPNPTRPSNVFDKFVRSNLQNIGVALGLPYEWVSGDYSGLSFSNLRAIRNDLMQSLLPKKEILKRHFCARIHREFLYQLRLKNERLMPLYDEEPWRYEECNWIPPGMRSVNPIQEAKANTERIKQGVTSPQRIAAEEGLDYDEIREEIALALDEADENNLFTDLFSSKTNTSAKTNPSALGAA